MPDNVSVMAPPSGTYGEGADLQRLRQSLPKGAVGNPAPPAAAGPPPGGMATKPAMISPLPPGRPNTGGAPPPGAVPAVLMGPTAHPNVPVGTPLAAPGQQQQQGTPAQSRLQLLYALSSSPDVDPVTREWAQVVIEHLLGPGAASAPTIGQPPQAPQPPPPTPAAGPVVGRG